MFFKKKEVLFDILEKNKEILNKESVSWSEKDLALSLMESTIMDLSKIEGEGVEDKFIKILDSSEYSFNVKKLILRNFLFSTELALNVVRKLFYSNVWDIRSISILALSNMACQGCYSKEVINELKMMFVSVLGDSKRTCEEYLYAIIYLRHIYSPDVNEAFRRMRTINESEIGYEKIKKILDERRLNGL